MSVLIRIKNQINAGKIALVVSFLAIFIAFGISGTPCISASSGICSTADTIIANILKVKSGTAFEATLDASSITANRSTVLLDEASQTVPDASGTSSGDILEAAGAGAISWVAPASAGGGPKGFQVFNIGASPATYTPTADTTVIKIYITGGGGGGNGNTGVLSSPGWPAGGGAGATAIKIITGVGPTSTCAVTIGNRGGEGAWAAGPTYYPGSDGAASIVTCTNTDYGSTITANGGKNTGAVCGYGCNIGGEGGLATGGDLNIRGGGGGGGENYMTTSNQGGNSYWGAGSCSYGSGFTIPANFVGVCREGTNWGAGGSVGGAGGYGVVVFEEF